MPWSSPKPAIRSTLLPTVYQDYMLPNCFFKGYGVSPDATRITVVSKINDMSPGKSQTEQKDKKSLFSPFQSRLESRIKVILSVAGTQTRIRFKFLQAQEESQIKLILISVFL